MKFVKGDRVIYVSNHPPYIGRVGVIIGCSRYSGDDYWYHIIWDGDQQQCLVGVWEKNIEFFKPQILWEV